MMQGGGMELVEVCPVEGCEWRDDPPGEKRNVTFEGDGNSWLLRGVNAVTAHLVEVHRDLVNLPAAGDVKGLFKIALWAKYAPKES